MNILIVEDDTVIREGTADFLREQNYIVFEAESAEEGLEVLDDERVHLVVLDIMLPGINGVEMLRHMRAKSQVPVIILTALDDEQTQVRLFDEYADDYLTKPFSLILLQKRIESLLRRHYGDKDFWVYEKAAVDFEGHTAFYDDAPVNLTTKEFQLLELLIENRDTTLSRDQILDHLWSLEEEPYERVIDVYVKNLRQKLHLDCIRTIKGVGYKLERR